jgi:hypothetical protein
MGLFFWLKVCALSDFQADNGLYQEQNRQRPKKKIFEEQKPKNPPRIQLQPDNLVGKKSYFEGVEKISLTGKVFSWKDKDGKMYFSNTDFPIDNETLQVQTEINGYSKVTKIKVTGGQIYIPVKLSNKGLSSTMHMVLDTGCTTTTVPYKYLTHLSPKYGREVVSRLADGNKMTSREVYLDMIQVGPRKERNVVLHAANIAGSQNDGLLGLDFLKNHKFKIDFENQFILWM